MKKKDNDTGRCALAARYAHRGYHRKPQIPENSMAAFRRAVEHGFPSELDVHLIADGSLAVFHDEELERETGVSGRIEEYDLSHLRELRLEGTDEKIPTLDEVLELYENTGLELLIELKPAGGNHRELAEAVCRRLDSYKGSYVLESFDPRALLAVRRLRPDTVRGQLVQNFLRKREGLSLVTSAVLTGLVLNPAVLPDFMAYRYEDRDIRLFRRQIERKGIPEAVWTIRNRRDYLDAEAAGCIPIFEGFDPDSTE